MIAGAYPKAHTNSRQTHQFHQAAPGQVPIDAGLLIAVCLYTLHFDMYLNFQ